MVNLGQHFINNINLQAIIKQTVELLHSIYASLAGRGLS